MLAVSNACPVCGQTHDGPEGPIFGRLWVYTNYDCNLACSYCLVSSSPRAERRGLPLPDFRRLIDEAAELGCGEVFLTGGEPALLPHITDMIAHALRRMRVSMLTNGMLWRGTRLARLEAVRHPDLTLQISLDSGSPAIHDRNRGSGSWAKTVAGIKILQERGFRVRTGTTETLHRDADRVELCEFLASIGIPPVDQIVRDLVARGASKEGAVLTGEDLVPEMTVDVDGVYWHPIMGDDLRITDRIFPLRDAAKQLARLWHTVRLANDPEVFR
jgi:MoaA/NifB/PqqE/SkfB family radical SAM enzyme